MIPTPLRIPGKVGGPEDGKRHFSWRAGLGLRCCAALIKMEKKKKGKVRNCQIKTIQRNVNDDRKNKEERCACTFFAKMKFRI